MDKFVLRLDKAKKAIDEADYIIIGAGAGLSTAAGIDYTGERFEKYFADFIDEYGFTDMYSSGFYPFESQEEKWAYWARHVFANRYDVGKTDVYQKLLKLVENKEYFVLTTNVEHQFWINGFDDERIFATQGDYGLLQCERDAMTNYIQIKSKSLNGLKKRKISEYRLIWFRNVLFAVGKWT